MRIKGLCWLFSLLLVVLSVPCAGYAGNRLAGESSLYLRQHANQPIDWYPWGDEALDRARIEGKLIFVSVGYAACHWCHVMARESFENTAIADLLNAGFISIKIDRERRPDLDAQFGLVTTLLAGRAGWPNSVFLTPDGAPFHAGGYVPPDAFTEVLLAVTDAWQNDRGTVDAVAADVSARVREYLDQAAVLGAVTSADITAAAHASIADLDEFNGGFGDATKFPREPFLLHLLDQAARHGDSVLLEAVTLTLDGMIRGGVHDQIGGGFHRYAIDPEWHVPHFEKMLYDQALMGRVLIRAYALTGNPDYRRAAVRTLDFVLRELRAPEGGFVAAFDADSVGPGGERKEGLYYLWSPQAVERALGDKAPPIIAALNIVANDSLDGQSIPFLVQSPTDTARLHDMTLAEFDARLELLRLARTQRTAPIRDEKVILSWNAEMIATLAEASAMLDRRDYLIAAEGAAEFLLDNLATAEGFMRIHFEGRADTPAQLADHAALGRAALALYDYGAGRGWLERAGPLAQMILNGFGEEGRAFRATLDTTGLGPHRPVDDTDLASGNALALDFLAGLDRRMARISETAPRLAAVTARDAIGKPRQRAGLLTAIEVSRLGPSGPMRVSSGGAVHVMAHADRTVGQMRFEVRIGDGWHINAHRPLDEYLIGMAVDVGGTPVPEAAFPEPVILSLGFSSEPLAVYEADFDLVAPLPRAAEGPTKATLTLQACNDRICLPPDDMVFHVWPTKGGE